MSLKQYFCLHQLKKDPKKNSSFKERIFDCAGSKKFTDIITLSLNLIKVYLPGGMSSTRKILIQDCLDVSNNLNAITVSVYNNLTSCNILYDKEHTSTNKNMLFLCKIILRKLLILKRLSQFN